MCRTTPALTLALTIPFAAAAAAQERAQVFTGATIYPIAGPPIENGALVVQGGKIQAVGAQGEVRAPSGAEVHDVTGKVLMPGLVDTHSHLGDVAGGDRSAALHPEVRTLDAVDMRADNFHKALAGGITTINVMPGSGHLMSGQTTYLKMRAGAARIEDLLFCDDPLTDVCGGMKMANGTNSQHDPQPPFPGTRGKSAALVRELFVKAQEQGRKLEHAGDDADKRPERDLGLEAVLEVLDGRRVVHHHTHRHDDVLTVLRLAEEFGFRPVLHHVSEAWRVADEIAAAGAPCSIIVLDAPGGKHEAVFIRWENGAALEKAGADVAFHTDDAITDSRFFLRSAGLAVRAGMSREKALEGLTLAGARMLDLDDRLGSLEAGKDADFILLSGDPLSVYTKVEQTWVEGAKVFDRAREEDRRYAVGGFEVYRGDMGHAHGRGGW
ncbi:MAG: amidohydrolase family protein [Thermoanaerobaculia bacterium]